VPSARTFTGFRVKDADAGPDHDHRRGKERLVARAEETVQLKDHGEARQITLFAVAGGELPQVRLG
jgi:hypothetical protein